MVGTVEKLAQEIRKGLEQALPWLSKPLQRKLPLAVAALLQARTPNTVEIAGLLPIGADRSDMRQQWLRRLLKNPLLDHARVMEPLARRWLEEAAQGGQTVLLSMDQSDVQDRFAVLMVSLRVGNRSLPLAWSVEAGEANIGWNGQKLLLERVKQWLPEQASVMLLADRFYPSVALFKWLISQGWQYRLRLKGNLAVDVGDAAVARTADLGAGRCERYEPHVRLFEAGIETAIGVLHDSGHKEPWIVAMDCRPNRAAVLDYGSRWAIEPLFSDFKTRGFNLEDTQLEHPERVHTLILLMALAMYWCVSVGRHDALYNPTPAEKKRGSTLTRTIGRSRSSIAAPSLGSSVGFACS